MSVRVLNRRRSDLTKPTINGGSLAQTLVAVAAVAAVMPLLVVPAAHAATPPSSVHIGPFGDGTNIAFQVNGYIAVQTAGAGQGPWYVNGSFAPTQTF